MAIIKVGSAAISSLVPEPGGEIQTNEFNSDVITLSYLFGDQSAAASVRPARGATYSGSITALSGFKVHDSTIQLATGKSARLRVLYKKPRYDLSVAPIVDSDLKVAGATILDLIKIPECVITRKYVSATRPDRRLGSAMSDFAGQSIGFPAITDLRPAWGFIASSWNPPTIWANVKFIAQAQCVGAPYVPFYFEVTEVWKAFGTAVII